jgi:hypothetical protein
MSKDGNMTLAEAAQAVLDAYYRDDCGGKQFELHLTVLRRALERLAPARVSPLEFVTITLEKEHLVGRPIIWAQWPNEEKSA